MNFNEYQKQAATTAIHRESIEKVSPYHHYLVLGLVNEAGEVADKIKKNLRDEIGVLSEEKKEEIAKELGDVLWYLSQLAKEFGFPLEAVAKMNLEKLASRRKRNMIGGEGDNR